MTAEQFAGTLRQRLEARASAVAARRLSRVQWIGYALLGLQFALFIAWSTNQYQRFALTSDFAFDQQPWYLIAHGDLNPYSTLGLHPFIQWHSEFLMWPLALLYWIYPQGVMLLWVQDSCVALAELLAFTWICNEARKRCPGTGAAWLSGLGIVLFAANPWIWWAVGWDFHTESLGLPLAVMLAWDLMEGRRRAWIWVVPLFACSDVTITYVVGIGLGAALARRRLRAPGLMLAGLGVAASVVIALVHGNLGSGGGLQSYNYLAGAPAGTGLGPAKLVAGVATHPGQVTQALWAKRVDIWAALAPAGLVGAGFPLLLPLAAVVLLASCLYPGFLFASPGFQNLPVYIFMPVGTVCVLAWLAQRHRRVALLISGLVAAQALGWAIMWLPKTPSSWLRVSAPAASTLAKIDALIPESANALISQGVVGRFSGRAHVEPIFGPGRLPLQAGENWFVVAPTAGIETLGTASAMALIGELAGPLHASLVIHANGVWAFRWVPPPGIRQITVPDGTGPQPAWAAAGALSSVGLPVLAGQVSGWHMTAAGATGYVSDGLQWQVRPGQYRAAATLSAAGPVNVEVWDDTTGTLLARRSIPSTTGIQQIAMPVTAPDAPNATAYSGWGPFTAVVLPPPPGQRIEVRVWSPGGVAVNVYSAALIHLSK